MNNLCLSKLMCKVMGMELVVAKELVFEHARNAFLGAFDDVLSVKTGMPEGFLWQTLNEYECQSLELNSDIFESMMFCDQVIRVVEMIEHYVSTYEIENKCSDFYTASTYIKNLCLNLATELRLYGDGGFHDLNIEREDINRLCSKDINNPKEFISEALWDESYYSDEPPYFVDREKIKSYLSERRYYHYPFLENGSRHTSEDISDKYKDNQTVSTVKYDSSREPVRALNSINVALTIAKYTIGNESVGSYHPEYSASKYITPFLFNGVTIAMENTKRPQIWVRLSDLRSLPRSVKYQAYDATTKVSNTYGRHSGLRAIKELAWDKVIKFKLSNLDDLQVVLSHLLPFDNEVS